MPRIQIDLHEDTHRDLSTLATDHGHKLKPFIEYLLRMQVGEIPIPSARPVQVQPEPEATEPEAPKKESPIKAARPQATIPETTRPEAIPEAGTVSRSASEYTKRTEFPNISTNGRHFFVSLLGARSFHSNIQEAKEAREAIRAFP